MKLLEQLVRDDHPMMLLSLSRILSINYWKTDALFPLRGFRTPGSIYL